MAQTVYGVNDPMAVKLWSKKLAVEALKATQIEKFIGTGADSLIQLKDETSKSEGDAITYGLRMQLIGQGVLGDGTLEGNEEALSVYSDKLVINQLRHAVRINGRMSQQRVPFNVRDESLSGLRDWFSDRWDLAFFNQIAGNTVQTNVIYTGNNATLAADSVHYLNVANQLGGLASPANTDADVSSPTYTATGSQIVAAGTQNATFQFSLIDRAKERAKTIVPAIRPIKLKGKDYYVMFIHPYQTTDMRTNTNPGQWADFQKAAITGGEITENPIFTGALGVYNGVIIHEDARVPLGMNGAGTIALPTVRRAIFCGAQAAMLAFGKDNKPSKMTWVEELFDYENELGVSAGSIYGLKKAQFTINGTATDFGTIVCSSYAAQH